MLGYVFIVDDVCHSSNIGRSDMFYPSLFGYTLNPYSRGFLPHFPYGRQSHTEPPSIGAVPYGCKEYQMTTLHLQFTDDNVMTLDPFHIIHILSKYLCDYKSFCSMLYRTKSIISGSTVLQMINHEEYHDSDMDIYAHSTYADEVVTLLTNEGYIQQESPKEEDPDYSRMVVRLYNRDRMSKVDVVICNGRHRHKDYAVIDAVMEFDLTCCMNFFNGKDIYMLHPVTTMRRISYLSSQTWKTHTQLVDVSNGKLTAKSEARLDKYVKRGYTMAKYRKRPVSHDPHMHQYGHGVPRYYDEPIADSRGNIYEAWAESNCWYRLECRLRVKDYLVELVDLSMHPECATKRLHGVACDCMGIARHKVYINGGYLYREAKTSFGTQDPIAQR